jgi:excisionase family DNA binding protein
MSETINHEEYLTLSQVAERAGVSRATIYAHIERGNLQTKRVGFYTVVTEANAEAFLKRLTKIKLGTRDLVVFQ